MFYMYPPTRDLQKDDVQKWSSLDQDTLIDEVRRMRATPIRGKVTKCNQGYNEAIDDIINLIEKYVDK